MMVFFPSILNQGSSISLSPSNVGANNLIDVHMPTERTPLPSRSCYSHILTSANPILKKLKKK